MSTDAISSLNAVRFRGEEVARLRAESAAALAARDAEIAELCAMGEPPTVREIAEAAGISAARVSNIAKGVARV